MRFRRAVHVWRQQKISCRLQLATAHISQCPHLPCLLEFLEPQGITNKRQAKCCCRKGFTLVDITSDSPLWTNTAQDVTISPLSLCRWLQQCHLHCINKIERTSIRKPAKPYDLLSPHPPACPSAWWRTLHTVGCCEQKKSGPRCIHLSLGSGQHLQSASERHSSSQRGVHASFCASSRLPLTSSRHATSVASNSASELATQCACSRKVAPVSRTTCMTHRRDTPETKSELEAYRRAPKTYDKKRHHAHRTTSKRSTRTTLLQRHGPNNHLYCPNFKCITRDTTHVNTA